MNVEPQQAGARTTLLIVEDEAIVARDLEVTLRGLGYDVAATTSDGRAAIELAERLRPDLVLMDIRLRGAMDGIEAATEVTDRLGIPVIFLTAYADEETLARARTALPFGYMVKPFLAQQLRPAIEVAVHRQRAERAFRQCHQQLRRALQELDTAVLVVDGSGGVRWANARAAELCGGDPAGPGGRTLAELLPSTRESTVPATVGPTAAQAALIRLDGTMTAVDLCLAPLDDGEGSRVVSFRASGSELAGDGARRHQWGQEELSRLATGLADHTRAPLLALSSTLQLVEVRGAHGPGGPLGDADTVPLLRRQVERIRDLVNYVVQFAAGGLALEPVPLVEVVDEALDRVRELAGHRAVNIVRSGGDDWATVAADRDRLAAALEALLENAAQHSPSGGTVDLRARADRARQQLHISVEDRGAGFDSADMPRLFEPFFSRRSGGTGMGLALAQRVAQLHGGIVEVGNRVGGGARVVLTLPLERAAPPGPSVTE